jgi:hypothetical protein
MVLAKSKKSVGLGNSLMNDRFSKGKGDNLRKGNFNAGIERTGQNGEKVCWFHVGFPWDSCAYLECCAMSGGVRQSTRSDLY